MGCSHEARAEQQVHQHREGLQAQQVVQWLGHLLVGSAALDRKVRIEQLRRLHAQLLSHGVKHRVGPADRPIAVAFGLTADAPRRQVNGLFSQRVQPLGYG